MFKNIKKLVRKRVQSKVAWIRSENIVSTRLNAVRNPV